jgi:hypothetical protein
MLINYTQGLKQAKINKTTGVNKPTSTVSCRCPSHNCNISHYLECRNLIKTLIQYLE